MITGYITLLLVIFLLGHKIWKNVGKKEHRGRLQKAHKFVGILCAAVGAVHLICTVPVWKTRAAPLVISGIVLFIICIIEGLFYRIRKIRPGIWLRYHRICAWVILAAAICHVAVYFVDFGEYQSKINEITIAGVSADGMKDGTYEGSYDAGYIRAAVEVTVKDGTIQNIRLLKHDNERGKRAESILDRVLEEQTTLVDTVSGASNSSRVILKAIENALQSN